MSGGLQRIYNSKIRSTRALTKVFRAQELIASSRIGSARSQQAAAEPYADAITAAVSAVAIHDHNLDHPMTRHKPDNHRAAVLVLGSDRGMAGSYVGAIIRRAESLLATLKEEDPEKIIDLYVAGRRAVGYFKYRNQELAHEWVYGSDHPTLDVCTEVANTLLDAFLLSTERGGVGEVYVVYTKFISLVAQEPRVVRILPLEIVNTEVTESGEPATKEQRREYPLYDFEPYEGLVLDALLPRYVAARVRSFMLEAAASEVASRQRAMHAAVDNAHQMIIKYSRYANAARQNDITQELTEIVSGADALGS
ncbi:MAG: F0F1 ATP synthase subunit gamma [Cellulomonadaceae bacterium]|jgi:F-type H+-transporting ATPase subunit gamma|nr:F0F1 ATP synthase subunit gamma [Cellulomonadaceae bacterium]